MKITRHHLVEKIKDYLNHKISLAELVDWAELGLMDADLDTRDAARLAEALARIGVMDMREFGLTWEDCEHILQDMGYTAHVELSPA
ncbi:MAG: hypothetical protein JJU29_17775 [Verrucomicrobia bacterium]|nr:hypothetical protein [Verrucomicrobiota bacterium]